MMRLIDYLGVVVSILYAITALLLAIGAIQ